MRWLIFSLFCYVFFFFFKQKTAYEMRISDWSSDVCSSDLYLTGRHGLGDDPWDARFNMIGGALYLAEMARRFGFPGAYAAYNAGPERYARHVRGAASLPAETRAYMASLSEGAPAPMVRGDGARPAKPR